MLSERDVELAHPEAFDFVWGNLPAANRADFTRHLAGCRHCQGVVEEYSEIGQIIQSLPPHVEPSPDLEDRTVAAMVAALAGQRAQTGRRSDSEDQAATSVYPIPAVRPPAGDETRVQPRPQLQPPAGDETRVQPRPQLQPPAGDETRVQPDRSSSLRPSRRPGRWSLSCLCGDVIEAASLVSLPSPLRSSLPPSSFRSALAGARSPRPRSQS